MGRGYLIAVVLFLVGLVVRDVYEALKRHRRIDPTNPRVFALVFASMLVMWVSWFAVGILAPKGLRVPPSVAWIGFAAVGFGVASTVAGMWQLGGVENIDHLVTSGLFAKTRHPMYTGFALWLVGVAVASGAPASLALAPLGLASVLWWRWLEETELLAHYGEEYRGYRAKTWF